MTPASAMYDALWTAIERETGKRRPLREDAASERAYTSIAEQALIHARRAYDHGSRGAEVTAYAASKLQSLYYAAGSIPQRLHPVGQSDREDEIRRFWIPAADALIAAARAQARIHPERIAA